MRGKALDSGFIIERCDAFFFFFVFFLFLVMIWWFIREMHMSNN